jgi:hypothetical protein
MQPAQRTVQREVARDAVRQRKAWDCGMGCDAFRLMLVQRNRLRCSARQILLRTTAKLQNLSAVSVRSTPIAAMMVRRSGTTRGANNGHGLGATQSPRLALEARFKPPAHLAVRLPASHMTVGQAGPTGSMTPWRQS